MRKSSKEWIVRRRKIQKGKICRFCGSIFVKAHGKPTLCGVCWDFANKDQRRIYAKATHRER